MKSMPSFRKVRGLTLIEFMISMVIGLVVVGAVLVSFVGSGRAGRYQAALTQMNQDAQIALNLLAREVQMAGYVSPGNSLGTSALFGCDGTAGAVPFASPGPTTAGAVTCGANTGTTVSALEVVYEADTKTTVPVGSPAVPSDCLGFGLSLTGAIYIARNRFYINTGGSGRPELYCGSNTGNAQPLIENVEDMQLWYGVAASASPTQVIRFAKAGKDATSTGTVNGQGASEWDNVNSVRICLLMRSSEPVLTSEDTLTYLDCNSASQTSNDKYMRRAYFTTATVRTKMAS